MKKIILFFLLIFLPIFLPFTVLADSGESTIVMEMSSGRILYSKNANEKKVIASITKIMTCIVVLENANLDKKITVGEEVLKMYGTNIYLELGEVLTVRDLLYGLMLRSGNDAAVVLAVGTMGSEEKFVDKMNKKAKEIGMSQTSFQNVHGLDDNTENYSTAYDMALLSKYAYQNKIYQKIVGTKKYITKSSLKSYSWNNRMSLLNKYKYCIGGKNGYTPKAGKTLVSLAKKNNMILTIVSLNDSNIYQNHKQLYEKYYSIYEMYEVINHKTFHMNSSFFPKGVYLKQSFSYPLKEEEIEDISTLVSFHSTRKNGKVGTITIRIGDRKIGSLNLYQKKKEEKDSSFFQKIKKLLL